MRESWIKLFKEIGKVLKVSDLDNLYLFLKAGNSGNFYNTATIINRPDKLSPFVHDDIIMISELVNASSPTRYSIEIVNKYIFGDPDLREIARNRVRFLQDTDNVYDLILDHKYEGTFINVPCIIDYLQSIDRISIMNCGAVIPNGKIIDRNTGRQVKTW